MSGTFMPVLMVVFLRRVRDDPAVRCMGLSAQQNGMRAACHKAVLHHEARRIIDAHRTLVVAAERDAELAQQLGRDDSAMVESCKKTACGSLNWCVILPVTLSAGRRG